MFPETSVLVPSTLLGTVNSLGYRALLSSAFFSSPNDLEVEEPTGYLGISDEHDHCAGNNIPLI